MQCSNIMMVNYLHILYNIYEFAYSLSSFCHSYFLRLWITFFLFTVLTSARLRSLKASRELIQELADPTANETAKNNNRNNRHFPPRVPTGKLTFTLEGITRTVNGWNVPGGWVEGMGLVKAGTGQVFKVCANPTTQPAKIGGKTTSTSPSRPQPVEILKSIAEINQWRCSGFPLYGQVRIFLFYTHVLLFLQNVKGKFVYICFFIYCIFATTK